MQLIPHRKLLLATFVALLMAGSFAAGAATQNAEQATRIAIDETTGIIRFFVGGVEKAQLNSDGLLVFGDVTYTGVTLDIGQDITAPGDKGASDE
jgi:hypothetical protein